MTKPILLINAPASASVYGALHKLSAIEPPVWAGLIANYLGNYTHYPVRILDAEAEGLGIIETAEVIKQADPLLAVFCIYGHQPSASTQCMPAATAVAALLPDIPTLALGTHPSALPERTLLEGMFTYVCQGEGPTTVRMLAKALDTDPTTIPQVPGLWYRVGPLATNLIKAPNIKSDALDEWLPGQAWHLLDMKKYRAHNWHLWSGDPNGGYASVQTSLGCPFRCLRGDALVNTAYGPVEIRELVEATVPVQVYTYKDGQVVLAEAVNIKKLGENECLVRVLFDNGTYIDCTPDHCLLDFNEEAIEAQCLQRGDKVRALSLYREVVAVSSLPQQEDVYCLEVPGYGWFFANNVLVKNCSFCCINAPFGSASIRYWSPQFVVDQITHLVRVYGITNIKIPDEMFCLNPRHVKGICHGLIQAGVGDRLNMWAYARIDTVNDETMLALMRRAGFRWLGIGIESASESVRDGVEKGRFNNQKIHEAVDRVRNAGIYVAANYIFGLPDDTLESMQATLDLAIDLNTEMANFYSSMAYPGSELHRIAQREGWTLPEDTDAGWLGYSQHAYESLPLRTKTLTAEQVLDFRDKAWMTYFTRLEYQNMMRDTFGLDVAEEISRMTARGMPFRKHRLAEDIAAGSIVISSISNAKYTGMAMVDTKP